MKIKKLTKPGHGELRHGEIDDLEGEYDKIEERGEAYAIASEQANEVLKRIESMTEINSEQRQRYLSVLKEQRTNVLNAYEEDIEVKKKRIDSQMKEIAEYNDIQATENNVVAEEMRGITSDVVDLEGIRGAEKEATENAKENQLISESVREEIKRRQEFIDRQRRRMLIDGLK